MPLEEMRAPVQQKQTDLEGALTKGCCNSPVVQLQGTGDHDFMPEAFLEVDPNLVVFGRDKSRGWRHAQQQGSKLADVQSC